jgi:hypothetical protein
VKALRKLFGQKDDPLMERADALVAMAHAAAIGTLDSLLAKFPFLRQEDEAHSDLLFTITGVFFAVTLLQSRRLGEARQRKLTQRIALRLNEWHPKNGVQAFEHCRVFFDRTYSGLKQMDTDQEHLISDIIGGWIVWDLLEHAPETEEERRLTSVAGAIITRGFSDWWNE